MPATIDTEIISEEKLSERPKDVRSISLPLSAANAAVSVADGLDKMGATHAAQRVRVGLAAATKAVEAVESIKPALDSVKQFVTDLRDKGLIKMAPRRRAFSPRTRVTK